MFLFYTYALTAVMRNTLLGFTVSANSLTALCNFDSLLGSVQDTVIGKVHLEKRGMGRGACISSIRLYVPSMEKNVIFILLAYSYLG